jgi:hypothetical protein
MKSIEIFYHIYELDVNFPFHSLFDLMKDIAKNILGSLGCLSFLAILFYALVTSRIIELLIIYLTFFGVLKLIDVIIISKLTEQRQNNIKGFFNRNIILTAILMFLMIFGSFFFGGRIVDGFTSVETLTMKLHERSKYIFSGSKCNDGFISISQGQGSCSWHNGVTYEFYKGEYSKTLEECRTEAEELSWIK